MTASQYISNLNEDRETCLKILQSIIFEIYPDIEETMGYNMPTYIHKGNTLCSIASQKNYMALYIMPYDLLDNFATELKTFNCGKSCIRFRELNAEKLDVLHKIIEYSGRNYSKSKFFGKMNVKR